MQHRAVLDEVRAALAALEVTDVRAATAELEQNNDRRRTVWGDRAAILPIAHGTADQVLRTVESCLENDFTQRGATETYIENRGDTHKIIVKVIFSQAFGRHEILRTGAETYAAMACTVGAEMPRPQIARPAARKPLVIAAVAVFALAAIAVASMLIRASARDSQLVLVARMTIAQLDNSGAPLCIGYVKHDFFENARVAPQLGRFFQRSDAGTTPRLAVISDSLFTERYARNPAILGTMIKIGSDEFMIGGVAPEGFNAPYCAQLWVTDP